MTALEKLGVFAATFVPDVRAGEAVRLHAADTVGAWIAATATEEGRVLRAFGRDGNALADRIAINVALARLSEIDDIHLGAMITPGAVIVPAALTIASSLPKVDAGLLAGAIAAGYEAMVRLGAAIDGPSVLYRGIWPTYFAAPFGVAAAAARLLQLDATRTANALSIALIMAAPGTGHHAAVTTARWLAVGHAAARGLQAAQAAAAGFTSDLKIVEGEFLKTVFGLAPDAARLAEGAGEPAVQQTSFKPWCAARQTMAATQALKEMIAGGVPPESVVRIEARVLPQHLKMIDHGVTAGDRFSHLTSLPYQMAVAALAPDTVFGLSGPNGPISPALAAFMARIAVQPDDSLRAEGYPRAWAAKVAVTTGEGRHERTVTHVPGDPARPFGESDVKAKFARVTMPATSGVGAAAIWAQALDALNAPKAMIETIGRLG